MSSSYSGSEEAVRVGKGVEGNWRVVLKGLQSARGQGQFGDLECGIGRWVGEW